MEPDEKRLLAAVILGLGALLWPVLAVYPFQYGWVESSILVGLFVLFGFYEFVLDDSLVE